MDDLKLTRVWKIIKKWKLKIFKVLNNIIIISKIIFRNTHLFNKLKLKVEIK